MIIKSFTSETVSAALKRVRTELGGDAVVLKTRKVVGTDGRPKVEITACLDSPTTAQAESALGQSFETAVADRNTTDEIKTTDGGTDMQVPVHLKLKEIDRKLDLLLGQDADTVSPAEAYGEEIDGLRRCLRRSDVPEEIVETVISKIQTIDNSDENATNIARQYLHAELSARLSTPIEVKSGDRVAVVGPAGSGKTSVTGRLAAKTISANQCSVALTTLDRSKVGSLDEIQCYADLIGVDVIEAAKLESQNNSEHALIIDTAALPATIDKLDEFGASLRALQPTHCLLTLSCLTSATDIRVTADRVKQLSPTHLVITMLDLSTRWGTVLTACWATDLPLLLVADSSSGTGSLKAPNVDTLTDGILGREPVHESA